LGRILVILLFAPVCALLAQPDFPDPAALAASGRGGLRKLVERYTTDQAALSRRYDAPWSAARRERLRTFYASWRQGLAGLDFSSLDRTARIDYLLLANKLDHEVRQLDLEAVRFEQMSKLIPFAEGILALHEARRRREPIDAEAAAASLTKWTEQLSGFRKQISEPDGEPDFKSYPRPVVNRAVQATASLRKTLKKWYGFYAGYDPLFTWWVKQPYEEFDESLEAYAADLKQKVLGLDKDDKETIIGDPIGRDALLADLASAMIPYTPEELIEIANKEFAWCDREMLRASRELGYGDDWHAALEHVKQQHVEPGKQPALIRDLAYEAIDFLKQRDLITIPPLAEEVWLMEMMSPERQKVSPFFLGGPTILVSYPTEGMSHEEKMMSMRGNNIHFARATVQHELIPGHELQYFMLARYRPYRRAFATPFWMEGWALYWELRLWDLGFPRSPEDRIGMLFWRMHRCARIIFSLSFHLGRMSPEQCIDFLVDRVGHERANATAEVRRSFMGGYGPLYQVAYLIGGLQFRALQRELVGSGGMTDRAFHDAVLRLGSMPVELVRLSLTADPIERDFTPSWRFYENENQ